MASNTAILRSFDESTSDVLAAQYASAERLVNFVRILVLGVLGIAAGAYAPFMAPAINAANVLTLTPMLGWAIAQHFVLHANRRTWKHLSATNAILDITAVSVLLVSYGLLGDPNLAVKSPLFAAYFVILSARPFTGSPRVALGSAFLAAWQYTAISTYLLASGRLPLLDNPTLSISASGSSFLDEAAKSLLIVIAGVVASYASSWNERTLRQAVGARRNSEARFRAVFDHSAVGVALMNETGHVLEANNALSQILDLPNAQIVGRKLSDLSPAEEAEQVERLVSEVGREVTDDSTYEQRFIRRDGSSAWGSVVVARAEGSRDVRLIAMVQDITDRKALEAKLLHQAFYDALTGLANRALFRDRVEHALQRTQRDQSEVAVLFLDLDNFKGINDTLGHGAGDSLLRVVATRLLNATRGCDTVARLGGDEFAVVLENVRTEADASIVAGRIMSSLKAAIELDSGNMVRVEASIGIARALAADSVDDLLRNADVAMYAAKADSRGGYVFFDPSMHTALVDRVMLETDLRRAVEENEFWIAYQPIVDLESRELRGLEALARWQHPLKGTIQPNDFIPVAEETGLIVPIGRIVLTEACRATARWNLERPSGMQLSITVNLSGKQLQSADLLRDVRSALDASGLPAERLILEITESVIMQNSELTLERLRQLKTLGTRLAIDDFGTGYSSLSYLQQFPVDILKIDRSFTNGLTRGPNEDALARTIIALGDLLTLRTIAEGVEQETQHDRLRDLGCDYGQGFLFGKPLAARDVDQLLRDGRDLEVLEATRAL
ncbi:MAG: putative bifunctional diguanylate cyclase/phosphodiesterase [Gemmatimonadota bacterium]